jgi:hypothetical protein
MNPQCAMANWFGNSTSLFKGRAPESPQPFEIDCECGQRHSGLRRQQHQRIICRACGTALFILPKDVYPASSEAIPDTRGKAFSVEIDDGEIAAAQQHTADATTKQRSATVKPGQPKSSGAAASKSSRAATPLPAPKAVRKEQEKDKPRGRILTPLRIVLVTMVAMIAVTLFSVVQSHRIEDARRRLAETVEKFNVSLERRDWSIARSQINQIVDDLDILDRDDASARRHRQFQREIKAMTDLARSSLFDILEESDANRARDAANWHDTFELHHEGNWLVMELPARRRLLPPQEDDDGEEGGDEQERPRYAYDFDLPVSVGGQDRFVKIVLNCDALGRLHWEEGTSRSVVMGAQLRELELSPEEDHWIVSFDASTAFLWANIETYEGLGFTFAEWNPRENMQALLNEQAAAMGMIVPADLSVDPDASEIAFRAPERHE